MKEWHCFAIMLFLSALIWALCNKIEELRNEAVERGFAETIFNQEKRVTTWQWKEPKQ